jgi:hypothetical protein
VYIPYGGGGAQFYHPSMGAWNYSGGTISPAYSSYYTPYGNTWLGTTADSAYYNSYYSPSTTWGNTYSNYTPSTTWGNTYSNYSSFYTPSTTWSGYTYPSTTYYYPSGYYSPGWGTTYYVNPGRGRGMFRR